MNHYNNDPKPMSAKFPGTCPTCNRPIKRGEAILYWPTSKKAYHYACSEPDYLKFLDSAADEALYSGTPYEIDSKPVLYGWEE